MTDDPTSYLAMKREGVSAREVYVRARADGFKRYQCLLLIQGVFDLTLDEAREIGHSIYFESLNRLPK